MKWSDYIFTISADLYRYTAKTDVSAFLRCILFMPGFRYTFLIRTAKYLKSKGMLLIPLYILTRLLLHHYQFKYGISIPCNTEIGPGFYIGHFGGIIVNSNVIIGKNCNINQGVTIGAAYGGKNPGTPIILDNIYLGPGSKIFGGITIGNHVAVGANCVVAKSIPDYGVVVGIPGELVSMKGSSEYVVNTIAFA
jgi:serine O-acetyltransferase